MHDQRISELRKECQAKGHSVEHLSSFLHIVPTVQRNLADPSFISINRLDALRLGLGGGARRYRVVPR